MARAARIPAAFAASLFLLVASTSGAEDRPQEGLYEVDGVTTVTATGDRRTILGKFVLSRLEDGAYATTFNFQTALPIPDGQRQVDITGSGDGRLEEGQLRGRAESQWLMAALPGLDPRFAFIPGKLGPRIVSSFVMAPTRNPDQFNIEIRSEGIAGDAGQGYAPTTTVLRATRVGDTPMGGRLPLPRPHDD